MKIDKLPILGICGYSGAGKTTLIEEVLLRLRSKNLKIAVAKHSSKSIQLDAPGKDSDRFFTAGAHVYLGTEQESFLRCRNDNDSNFISDLQGLARSYDLVLVEGYKGTSIPKVWLLNEGEKSPPASCQEILAVLERDQLRADYVIDLIETWLPGRWLEPPVFGCILIGGKSSRMGRPKHLIREGGKTWLELTIEKLQPLTDRVVVVGRGDLPENCKIDRLIDPPQIDGPIGGLLAAFRWAPWSGWIVAACDMPDLHGDAVKWLLDQRQPGRWAIVPSFKQESFEPLLAFYDFRIHQTVEEMAAQGKLKPGMIGLHHKTAALTPPEDIKKAWRNVNLPSEI